MQGVAEGCRGLQRLHLRERAEFAPQQPLDTRPLIISDKGYLLGSEPHTAQHHLIHRAVGAAAELALPAE